MKKETFMLGLLLVISLAVVAQKNNYSIVGTITGYDGAYVKMHNKETNADIDSAIIANGMFQFRRHTVVVVNTEDRSMSYTLKNARQQVARQAVRVLDEDKVMYDSLVATYDAYTQQMKDYVDSAGWSLYEANAENKIGGEI